MKVNEVPQDTTDYYEGKRRACYAVDDEGRYVIVPSSGWNAEETVNGLAVAELAESLERTRRQVIKGTKSPLAYHMERRQMTPAILAKTAGFCLFRVRRHLRPDVFRRLKQAALNRYAQALAVTCEELKSVPGSAQGERL